MESVVLESAVGQHRPSRLVAEALVHGHDCKAVKERAEAMGLPEHLTDVVVSVCCRQQQGKLMPVVEPRN